MSPDPRPQIARLHAYTPGEQPTWADTAHPDRPTIKLNTNENPYPPADPVLHAIRNLPAEALRLYPPPAADRFRQAAGQAHNLPASHVLATNGGDELLRLLITCYCNVQTTKPTPDPNPKDRIGIGVTAPTYSLYPVLADIHGTPIHPIPRDRSDFAPPPAQQLADAWNQQACQLAFFVNPHAPSGRLESLDYLATLADVFQGLLVIDEAYVDFAPQSAIPLIDPQNQARQNVVLLRSLSKGYSLAGLRFGYGLAHPNIIDTLDKARDSYNTDILAQVAATAALQHQPLAQASWQAVIEQRQRLTDALRDRDFVVLNSHSNFLLATPPNKRPTANQLYAGLKQRDILIRYFNDPLLADRIRITIGTPDQNQQLLNTLDDLLA